jgi:hypothetical protein
MHEPVVRHAAGWARRGRVVRARAARRAVRRVRVDEARALAADGEAGAVEGALERRRAVRAEVDRAVRDAAALVVRDAHGEVVPIDERDVVVVVAVRGRKRELGERRGRDARACVRVADEAAVAAAVEARVRARVAAEVAVTAGLATGEMDVSAMERMYSPRCGQPSSCSGPRKRQTRTHSAPSRWSGMARRCRRSSR